MTSYRKKIHLRKWQYQCQLVNGLSKKKRRGSICVSVCMWVRACLRCAVGILRNTPWHAHSLLGRKLGKKLTLCCSWKQCNSGTILPWKSFIFKLKYEFWQCLLLHASWKELLQNAFTFWSTTGQRGWLDRPAVHPEGCLNNIYGLKLKSMSKYHKFTKILNIETLIWHYIVLKIKKKKVHDPKKGKTE